LEGFFAVYAGFAFVAVLLSIKVAGPSELEGDADFSSFLDDFDLRLPLNGAFYDNVFAVA